MTETPASGAPTGTVTFLFTDIEDSSKHWDLRPLQMEAALPRHDEILRSVVGSRGGRVFKTMGDEFCVVFDSPREAVLAALEAQRALLAEEWAGGVELRVRMALNTGVAEEQGGDYFGPPLNVVSRLMGTARGGQVVLSGTTHDLVVDRISHLEPGAELRHEGERRFKGIGSPMRVYQLLAPGLPGGPLRPTREAEEEREERYRVEELLGSGGMAQVYLAHDTELEIEVAYKRLRPEYAEDPSVVERFKREATNAAKLSGHPNIVQIRDRGMTREGSYFIVMEYVRGGTLAERIEREGAIPPAEAAALALQVARALKAAHARRIVHRDIKPQNVLLTEEGEVKVADFGIAKALDSKSHTSTGVVLGTPYHVAPEQVLNQPVSERSDFYALGVVLYQRLTGEVPFEADTPWGVAMKHVQEEPRPPREVNPGVPEELSDLTMRLLAKDPDSRPKDAGALVEELERMVGGVPPPPGGEERVRVPNLSGKDVAQAADALTTANLRLGAQHAVPSTAGTRGSVVGQSPAPGAEIGRNTQVNVTVSTGTTGNGETSGGGGGLHGGGKDRRTRPLILGGLAAVLVVAVAVGAFLYWRASSVEVPDLVGMTLASAEDRAGDDFELEIDRKFSETASEDSVMSQDPDPGEQISEGSTLSLIVSSGPPEEAPANEQQTKEEEGAQPRPDGAETADQRPSNGEASGPAPGYKQIQDPTGGLAIEVPLGWQTLTGEASEYPLETWENWSTHEAINITSSITATPDIETWYNLEPPVSGAYVVASKALAQRYTDDGLIYSGLFAPLANKCTAGPSANFDRPPYSGKMQRWDDCRGQGITNFLVAAAPEGRECVVFLQVRTASEADYEAAQHILDTFDVDCGEIAETETTASPSASSPSSSTASSSASPSP